MRTSNGLLGILLVDFVADFIAFFWDGQHPRPGKRLQRIRRLWMNHPHPKPQGIANIGQYQCGHEKTANSHYEFLR